MREFDYDALAVRELLKEVKSSNDRQALIVLCDKHGLIPNISIILVTCLRHGFVEDLTRYLFRNGQVDQIEAYVQNMNPANTPYVVGELSNAFSNIHFIFSKKFRRAVGRERG